MGVLQYLIDNMCANFTAGLMMDLVREQIAAGAWTADDITQAAIAHDPSLDAGSARTLIAAAVDQLVEAGHVAVIDGRLQLVD